MVRGDRHPLHNRGRDPRANQRPAWWVQRGPPGQSPARPDRKRASRRAANGWWCVARFPPKVEDWPPSSPHASSTPSTLYLASRTSISPIGTASREKKGTSPTEAPPRASGQQLYIINIASPAVCDAPARPPVVPPLFAFQPRPPSPTARKSLPLNTYHLDTPKRACQHSPPAHCQTSTLSTCLLSSTGCVKALDGCDFSVVTRL